MQLILKCMMLDKRLFLSEMAAAHWHLAKVTDSGLRRINAELLMCCTGLTAGPASPSVLGPRARHNIGAANCQKLPEVFITLVLPQSSPAS